MGSICCHKPPLLQEQGLGFFPLLSPTLQPTRCSALKIIVKSGAGRGGCGAVRRKRVTNEVKLLPVQELEAARTLLSTMDVSHFHSPPAGSQLHGTFCFKCTTTVIFATSRRQSTPVFFLLPLIPLA